MANRIKGITIEIGGDTTKLDKALSGTEKHLNATQKSLKDVEKLLKMDPGNTELLAQKQRLLADAVDGTREKLNTLREAAKNADDALARGQAYEKKYAPLKEEIEQVSNTLDGLKDNQKSMENALAKGTISTATYDNFQKKVSDTEKKLDDLKQAQKEVEAEFKGAKLNQSQYDALQRELIETEEAAKDAEKAFKNFNAAAEKVSATAGKVAEGAGKVQDATRGISTAAAGVVAAAIATVPATEELRADLSMLDNNAREAAVGIDVAREAFQAFAVVSNEVDSSVEATSNLLQAGFTESNLQKAVEGLAGAYLRFPDTLKIESLADSLQETLATGTATGQFGELLDRLGIGAENFSQQLAQIPDAVDKQNFALATLAHEGLMETYNGWMQNNQALADNRNASLEFQQTLAEFAESIQPFLTSLLEIGTGLLEFFNGLPPEIKVATGAVLLLIAAISPVAGLVSSIAIAVSLAGASFAAWTPIILGVVVALTALAAIIAVVMGKKSDLDSLGSSGRGEGFGSRAISTQSLDIPHLATGTVARRNNPFLAVVGDNTREDEVIAPYSTIKQAAQEAISESGAAWSGSRSQTIVMNLDGRTFARIFVPYIDGEYSRLGVSLVK